MKSAFYVFFLIIIMNSVASASTIECNFTVESDNGTMMHYNYFREPRLQESNFKTGYKAGSLNYLENGKIKFTDTIWYYDGQIDAGHPNETGVDHNATYYNKQYVDFNGDRGISEIYAKGFFPNNRAVSGWKKIRYESYKYPINNTPNYYNNLSSRILVDARVLMGNKDIAEDAAGDYDFDYKAEVENGVIEIWDATGWTNQTGSKRIDWEKTALIRGNAKLRNHLIAYNLSSPGAGAEADWLPCCYSATKPPVINEVKPAMLKPDIILPAEKLHSSQCTQNCKDECNTSCSNGNVCNTDKKCKDIPKNDTMSCWNKCVKDCTNFTCSESKCEGYECIFTYDPGLGPAFRGPPTPADQTPRMAISKKVIYKNEDKIDPYNKVANVKINDTIRYSIHLASTAKMPLKNVVVIDMLPDGLSYDELMIPQVSFEDLSGESEPRDMPATLLRDGRWLSWNFTEIKPGGGVLIKFRTKVGDNSTKDLIYENEVAATGIIEIGGVEKRATAGNKAFKPK